MNRTVPKGSEAPLPGAYSALALLLLINMFNYIDRQILAAVVGPIKKTFFTQSNGIVAANDDSLNVILQWFQNQLGFKPEDALLGLFVE